MQAPALQWSAAAVSDHVLTVEIGGDRPKGFKSAFERTVALLGGGPAGAVKLKGSTVRVQRVEEGAEETLHHFLESALQEVNAALAVKDPADENEADADADADHAVDDADARMTERFRGFHAA